MGKQRVSFGIVLLFGLLVVTAGILLYSKASYTGFTVVNTCTDTSTNCTESWQCTDWGTCTDGSQARTCTDSGACGTTSCKPAETQSCTACTENWTCSNWEACGNGSQARTCTDSNSCGTTANKPAETQSCTSCTENWECSDWSNCSSGSQARTCTDSNSCGTTANKPAEAQNCTCVENWGCTNWSECNNGVKTRTCTDSNSCGTTDDIPSRSHNCTETSSITTDVSVNADTCTPNWQCGDWQECTEGNQIRVCTDANSCGSQEGIPATTQACTASTPQIQDNETKKESKGFFTIVGSVVKAPFNFVFTNKTRTIIFSGFALLIAGFFVFRFFFRKGTKNQAAAPAESPAPKVEIIKDENSENQDSSI